MPLTPAKKHFQKQSAKQNNESADLAQHSNEQTNQYEIMLMMLADHKRKLKEIQSQEMKAEFKADVIDEYEAYIDGVIESDCGVQDDVLMNLMVWFIDIGNIESALRIGAYALKHNMQTPEQYKRDTATLLAEETAEFALRYTDKISITLLLHVEHITTDKDMPDEVRAKLYKSIGLKFKEIKDNENALKHFQRALELNERSGVKKLIEVLEREIKNAEEP